MLNPGVMYTSFGSENNGRKRGKEYRFLQVIKHFQIYSLPSNPMDFYCLFKLDYNNLLLLPNLTTIDAGGMLC